ncbi:MAG: glycine--tRNA ligase subunit beta [Acidobacteriota bacterium]|nr:glycine--tRNA ligase subunit beta [Acidobacteriota bacterium]
MTVMDRELLLEIGCEELPASWLPGLTTQLADVLGARLAEARIKPGTSIETYSTPRRLTARIAKLSDRQDDLDETVTGPPVSAARGADGQPTPAALGFAKKQGVAFDALEELDTPKGRYLAHRRKQRGRATADVLAEVLGAVLRGMSFPKQMHWEATLDDGKGDLLFGRPIRWLLYLYGGRVVPFSIQRSAIAAGPRVEQIATGAVTYGHRFLATSGRPGRSIKVRTFEDYESRLAEHFVVLSRIERRDRIVRGLERAAKSLGGRAMVQQNPRAQQLLDEVPDLVEYPAVVAGIFSPEFLALPEEVLTTTLIHHQHCFPVCNDEGGLKPGFLQVVNTAPQDERTIARNAARVITARLRDASFFWEADKKTRLEDRLDRLDTVLFHKALGSYRVKAERMEALARTFAAGVLGLPPATADHAARAARLAKADLTTDMVREFTELQGTMGGVYAREQGEPEAVWKAIYFHYLPIATEASADPSRDRLGEGASTWAAVSLADKVDTLAGLIGAGERPTGSRDPFGLRRAAQGVVRILIDLPELTGSTAAPVLSALLPAAAGPATDTFLPDFLVERLRYVLEQRGYDARNVRAVTHAGIDTSPLVARRKLEALPGVVESAAFQQLATAFKRVRNIARELDDAAFEQAEKTQPDLAPLLQEPAEKALLKEIDARRAVIETAAARGEGFGAAFTEAAGVGPAVDKFFTEVFVMADDAGLRQARLRLMKRLERLILKLADVAEIVAEK